MFCGVAPRLANLTRMGSIPVLFSWISFARWFIECLYVDETIRMSDAWRMPPTFYQAPGQESVLLGLESLSYVEGSFTLNICLLLLSGIATRSIALMCLYSLNRHQMGLPPVLRWSNNKTNLVSTEDESSSSVKSKQGDNEKTQFGHQRSTEKEYGGFFHSPISHRHQVNRGGRDGGPARSISNALLARFGMRDSASQQLGYEFIQENPDEP